MMYKIIYVLLATLIKLSATEKVDIPVFIRGSCFLERGHLVCPAGSHCIQTEKGDLCARAEGKRGDSCHNGCLYPKCLEGFCLGEEDKKQDKDFNFFIFLDKPGFLRRTFKHNTIKLIKNSKAKPYNVNEPKH